MRSNPNGRKVYTYMRITATQKQRDVLDFLAKCIGFGNVRGPYKCGRNTTQFIWYTTGFERTQAAIAMMWPWLSERRRDQYRRMLVGYQATL